MRRLITLPFVVGIALGAFTMHVAADMLGSAVFSDVPPGSYYDAAVGRLYGQGIVKGVDGKYFPDRPVNRAEVAVMIDRAINGDNPVSVSSRASRSSSTRSSSSSEVSSASSSVSSVTVGTAGAFRFAVDKVTISEASANLTLSIIRYGGKSGAVSVQYATSDGTAKSTEDYNPSSGTVSFADGETSKLITMHLVNDLVGEPNETFLISLSGPTGSAVVGTPSVATITMLDNDGGGTGSSASAGSSTSGGGTATGGSFTYSALSYAVDENAGAVSITVLRQGSASLATTVDYETVDGTASAGKDYTKAMGTLSFGAGETSKTFSVQVNDSTTIEGNRTVALKLLKPTGGANLGSVATASLSIVDNESAPTGSGTVLFSGETFTTSESSLQAVITLNRRGDYGKTVSVKLVSTDSTATAGSDYTTANTVITFGPNESSKTFTMAVVKDALQEGEERVNLQLNDPVNVMLGNISTATLKIFD